METVAGEWLTGAKEFGLTFVRTFRAEIEAASGAFAVSRLALFVGRLPMWRALPGTDCGARRLGFLADAEALHNCLLHVLFFQLAQEIGRERGCCLTFFNFNLALQDSSSSYLFN
jgi:hypothetical protein